VAREPVQAAKLAWQPATVTAIEPRTPTVKSYFFRLAQPLRFVAGQHMDVRLTAPDGYQAQRSYSIASAPETAGLVELAIERLDDGEVSPFFHDVVAVGDEIELRGPIGGHFNWSVDDGGPLLLVGGGSGVVPLACMLRHRAARSSTVRAALVYSARTAADLIFGDELRALAARADGFALFATLTREASPPAREAPNKSFVVVPAEAGTQGSQALLDPRSRGDGLDQRSPEVRTGRIDAALLGAALAHLAAPPKTVFVCGANAFVETAADVLIGLGIAPSAIRTERYGG
jgi:ferredoxin-NADP reductase